MNTNIRIIGIPMDLGQAHRGVDMGPSAIRYAGLTGRLQGLGYTIKDSGDLAVPLRYTLPGTSRRELLIAIRQVCEMTYQSGCEAINCGEIPIFLGGDHSLAIGTVGGVTEKERVGVLWIDAHGDYNTPNTSDSGNIHGMALAILLGNGCVELIDVGRRGAKVRPEDVVMVGVRELDAHERKALQHSGIRVYTMRDIDEKGVSAVMAEALDHLAHLSRLHVSLDMDSLDPMAAPGVGTPSHGGLTYREAQLLMEIVADTKRLSSLDIVEINPVLDQRNKTAKVAVELVASLFGKSIL